MFIARRIAPGAAHAAAGLVLLVATAARPESEPRAVGPIAPVPGETLSPVERVAKAQEYLVAAEQSLGEMLVLAELARQERQTVRVVCVLEKTEQAVAMVKAIRRNVAILSGGEALADAESLRLYDGVVEHYNAVQELNGLAKACVGELAGFAGGQAATQVRQLDPPYSDPSQVADPVEIITRPPAASPYQLRERP